MTNALEAENLTKRFGKLTALDSLNLAAPSGQVVAVLGPNGSGKTTLVRSVSTVLRPDAGSLRIYGVDALKNPNQVRRMIGLAGQYAAVEGAMTGRENLEMVARMFGHDRRAARRNAAAVSDQLDLTAHADRLARTYSGGMRRRLDLGASLVGAPRLLLLDEPTTGLDPRSRLELWEAVRALVDNGTDVLLTTQYLEEAEHLASQIVIIEHGHVVATGTPGELRRRVGRDVIEVTAQNTDDVALLEERLASVGSEAPRTDPATRRVTIPVEGGRASLRSAIGIIDELATEVDDISLRRPNLNEVFLALTGKTTTPTPSSDPASTQPDERQSFSSRKETR